MSIQKDTLKIGDFMTRLRQFSDPFEIAVAGDEINKKKLQDLPRLADEIRLLKKEMIDICGSEIGSQNIDQFFNKWNNMVFGVLYAEENYRKNGDLSPKEIDLLKTALEEIREYCRSC